MPRARRVHFRGGLGLLLAAGLPLLIASGVHGEADLSSSGPIAIGVYKRSYEAPIGYTIDDPRALDKRLGVGAIRGRTDDRYRYDPYGYRSDLGFYQRSWLDKDGDPTLSPMSSNVPAYLPSRSRERNRDRERARSFERYPSRGRSGLSDSPHLEPRRLTPNARLEFDQTLARQLRETYEASGWTPLADGRSREALVRFTRLAERNPHHGVPRVGVALASATLGELEQGVEMMREALRVDADALVHVPVEPRLRKRLAGLASGYAPLASSLDREFMRASLYYLSGSRERAAAALERAMAEGDTSESSSNLRQLIDARAR